MARYEVLREDDLCDEGEALYGSFQIRFREVGQDLHVLVARRCHDGICDSVHEFTEPDSLGEFLSDLLESDVYIKESEDGKLSIRVPE